MTVRNKLLFSSPKYYVVRGVLGGIFFSFLFNYQRWFCLMPKENLADLYKRIEPSIPENFLQDLSEQEIQAKEKINFTLQPKKILDNLTKNPNEKYLMIIIFKVGVMEAKKRFLSRQTWASVAEMEGKKVGIIFITSFTDDEARNKLLSEENNVYGDILQTSLSPVTESFGSKLIMSAYLWIGENIGDHAELIVTIDNDIFPFLPNIYEYAKKMARHKESSQNIHCASQFISPIHKPRHPLSPNYVKRSVYNNSYYPSHCSSGMVITSAELSKKLYETGMRTITADLPDNIYLWGILREKVRAGGPANIINYANFVADVNLHPLGFDIKYNTYDAKKRTASLWERIKSRLKLTNIDKFDERDKITVKLVNISTKDPESSPEKDMKHFLWRWGHIPVSKKKS